MVGSVTGAAPTRRDMAILAVGAFLRTFGVGLTGVLLGLYLTRAGYPGWSTLLVVALGLTGSAAALFFVSRWGDRFGRRRLLIAFALLSSAGAALLLFAPSLPWVGAGALLGLVSGMGRDRGPGLALEQAILPSATTDRGRTTAFAVYHLLLDVGHGVGSLAAATAALLTAWWGLDELLATRLTLGALVAAGPVSALLYLGLSSAVDAVPVRERVRFSPSSRKVITRLASLFALDSLGGGFLPNALLSQWFFERFGLTEATLGPLFAVGRGANAISHLGAAWLARRIGLIRTMVWTHIPSSLILASLPFVPSAPLALALYVLRELLVEMDLPTRQSFTMAVVAPHERTAAAGVTGLVRATAWAAGAGIAAGVVPVLGLSAPLFIGAGMKVVYDGLLYASMRAVKPPEERGETPA
jgi:MFS family permease